MTLYLAIRARRRDSARAIGACACTLGVRVELCEYVHACVVRESYPGGRVQACTHGAMCSVRRRRKRTGSERKVDERDEERRGDVTNERGLRERRERALYASDPVTLPVVPLDLRASLWGSIYFSAGFPLSWNILREIPLRIRRRVSLSFARTRRERTLDVRLD